MMQPFDDEDKPTTEHHESYVKHDQAFVGRTSDDAKVAAEQEIVQSELSQVLLREKPGEHRVSCIDHPLLKPNTQSRGHLI
jgi:hypothetical protein